MLAYDVYRDQGHRGTVPAGATTWTDPLVPAGTHTWTVQARDLRETRLPPARRPDPSRCPTRAPRYRPRSPRSDGPAGSTSAGRGRPTTWPCSPPTTSTATAPRARQPPASPARPGRTPRSCPASRTPYAVVARDAAGNSSTPSNTVTAASSAASTLGPPTNLAAVQLNAPGQVALSWSAPTSGAASSYDVTRDGTQLAAGTTSTSVTDPSAPDGTPSRYTVIARDDAGSTASATLSVTPDWTAPTPPGAVSVTPQSASSVAVTWGLSSDAVGVTGYTVTRTDPGGGTTQVAQVPGTGPVSVLDSHDPWDHIHLRGHRC